MTPIFFEFVSRIPDAFDPKEPWAASLDALLEEVDPGTKCSNCGARRMRYRGPGEASGLTGSFWGDIIGGGSMGPGDMVSERVLDGLRKIEATGFKAYPVRIRSILDQRLTKLSQPRYYYLSIHGRIEINCRASGLDEPCPVCGALIEIPITHRDRLVAKTDSWDGSDFFYGKQFGGPYCSDRVLLLAREQRWTNFRFYPLDRSEYERTQWDGIDYLGPKWPPLWYADRPSAGKTLDEWLAIYFIEQRTTEEQMEVWYAERALEDLGSEALPPLLERYRAGSAKAGYAIHALAFKGVPMPQDLKDEVEQSVFTNEHRINPHLFIRDDRGLLRRRVII